MPYMPHVGNGPARSYNVMGGTAASRSNDGGSATLDPPYICKSAGPPTLPGVYAFVGWIKQSGSTLKPYAIACG